MSHNSPRGVPTPFHHIASDARSDDSRSVLSSPRTSHSSRSSSSTAVSSWINDGVSQTSSPSPSQWVGTHFPLPPASTHPPQPLSPDAARGLAFPPPAFPETYASGGPYSRGPPYSYTYPAASDDGSASSRRSAPSAHAHPSTGPSVVPQEAKEGGRPLDSVPCQICLEPEIMCRCGGDEEARLRMRLVAKEVFDRGPVRGDNWQVAPPQAGGYVPGYYAPVPVVYAGGPAAVYPGQAVAAEGYVAGYYPSPGSASTSRTWVEQQGSPRSVGSARGG